MVEPKEIDVLVDSVKGTAVGLTRKDNMSAATA